jgi:exoribonuclease II
MADINILVTDATRGTARVEAIDANDQPPMFIPSTLFAAVEENAVFGTSVITLEVSTSALK